MVQNLLISGIFGLKFGPKPSGSTTECVDGLISFFFMFCYRLGKCLGLFFIFWKFLFLGHVWGILPKIWSKTFIVLLRKDSFIFLCFLIALVNAPGCFFIFSNIFNINIFLVLIGHFGGILGLKFGCYILTFF